MALPGRKGPVIPTFKVSIGERKSKTSRPETMDYITIRYYSRDKEVWVVHRELQARLEEIAASWASMGRRGCGSANTAR